MRLTRRAAVILPAVLLVSAACGGGGATTAPTAPASATAGASATAAATASGAAEGCTVGMSWNNYQEERWARWDEPALKAAIEAGGGTYTSNDAGSSEETQITNVENLINDGADVVVILAQNTEAILPAVEAALAENIPVIAYDRLIESPDVLYTSFDNVKVGEMQAQAVLDVVSEGNFVVIKGNGDDANSDFLRQGMVNAGIPDVGENSDTITIVGESYTDNWDPAIAQTTMEQFLTDNDNEIDAALVENDGMAGGAIAALEAQGMAGTIPVSGQDGDQAALNRVALGTQTVSVWKDARELGTASGEAAIALCENGDPSAVAGTAPFTTPGGNEVAGILLEPIPVTQENLNVVLEAEWIDEETLCQGVTAGSVDGCP
ncbi:MAG TPA: substrate-binding domain-containing protein [Candidatus Limnocylindrales bacterium]|jgi:D-xylose transport system substrate-binding protein|nr:substrate-binding domain-containing protein [Candidatus Limnocylindrales bacterium]